MILPSKTKITKNEMKHLPYRKKNYIYSFIQQS